MSPKDQKLRRDLALALVIKLILIMALWWFFFRSANVAIDDEATARHLITTAPPATSVNGESHAQ